MEQQTLLELHYWHELDAEALGEVFDATSGAIRVRLLRARKAEGAQDEAACRRALEDAHRAIGE